jgi:endonuclease/exonuclease/phosphatase family metal-dependent hydrolase
MKVLAIIAYAILFLFFFQLISDFIQGVYAFGLLQADIPVDIVATLLLLAPFLLVLSPGGARNGWPRLLLVIIGEGMVLSRVIEVFLNTRGRMLVSGLGVFLFLLLFPALLYESGRRRDESAGPIMGAGLTLGLGLSITLRSLNSSLDLSTVGWTQAIGWVLALLLAILLPKVLLPANGKEEPDSAPAEDRPSRKASRGRITGLSLGIVAVFILLYFAFTSPTVIARWTRANYLLIVTLSMFVLTFFAWLVTSGQRLLALLPVWVMLAVTAVFAVSLGLTLWLQQVSFPATVAGYPIAEPEAAVWHQIPLVLTLLLMPIILLDFALLVQEIVAVQPTMRTLGLGFGIASLFLLAMIFAQVFTSAYAYMPVIGPFFRDKYWLVFLTGGLVLTLSTILLRQETYDRLFAISGASVPRSFPMAMLVLGLISAVGVLATMARPPEATSGSTSLTVLNYNLQQGYGADGQFRLDDQLALIKEIDADIIGLQETDSSRIAGGNTDIVRYLADRLDMHSYYGPTPVTGTFGDVLLSKYPIENPKTHFLYSEGEQVALVEAQITAGDRTFSVCVNHFGNTDDPVLPTQADQFVELCAEMPNLVAPGDYNFSPEEPDPSVFEGVSEELDNSWQLCGKPWPERKIEHIFVSRGMKCCATDYVDSPASDHPAEWAEICW